MTDVQFMHAALHGLRLYARCIYLIIFKSSHKPVTLDGVVTGKILIGEAERLFPEIRNSTVTIQAYDNGFKEYADLDLEDVVQPLAKVKVIASDGATTSEKGRESGYASTASSAATANEFKDSETTSTPDTAESDSKVLPQSQHYSSAWFATYALPKFPTPLTDKLQAGETLSSSNESAILDIIFESIRPITLYPTPRVYAGVVDQLLSKYPKLCTMDNASNNKQLWISKVKYKFQNKRNRDETIKNTLQVKERKRKQAPKKQEMRASDVPNKPAKYPPMFGLINYLPVRDSAEDELTVKRHIDWLINENKKKRPDFKEVTMRMDLTFADRRQLIVKGSESISNIKDQYPWLFKPDADEFLTEFRRIHGQDVVELFKQALSRMARPLSKIYEDRCKRAKKSQDRTDKEADVGVIDILPSLFKEDIGDIFCPCNKDDKPPIHINIASSTSPPGFTLVIEGQSLCTLDDKTTALACYLAGFYIFHLGYVPQVVKTLEFCQIYVLGITDKCPVEKSVLSMINRLKKQEVSE